jgi:hypothetical protein
VLNADPRPTSCLMTSMTDPREGNFLICWQMYRAGEDVYIQHALILVAETEDFDLAAPWDHIGPRRGTDDDGNKISEWVTSMDSLRKFFG